MARRLLQLNGIAIIGVLVNHAVGWGFIALFWWTDRYREVAVPNFDAMGSLNYLLLRVLEAAVAFTIPAFLLVSGYFAAFALRRAGPDAQTAPAGGQWSIVGSRIRVLLVPYLIWSAVYLGLDAALGSLYSPLSYARRLAFGGASPGFYYVPLLIQFYLMAPFLVRLAQRHWKSLLVGAAALQGAAMTGVYLANLAPGSVPAHALAWLTPSWFFPGLCFWFVAGLVAGTHVTPFRAWLERAHKTALILVPLALVASMVEWEAVMRAAPGPWTGQFRTITDELNSAAVIVAFLGAGAIAPRLANLFQTLGPRSFGIYLANALGLTLAAKAVSVLVPAVLPHQLIFQPLLVAAGLAVPLGLMWLVDRSPLRRYYRYLFG